ncbi:hypothetical protein COD88_29035, partial [Bacillus cereus]
HAPWLLRSLRPDLQRLTAFLPPARPRTPRLLSGRCLVGERDVWIDFIGIALDVDSHFRLRALAEIIDDQAAYAGQLRKPGDALVSGGMR